MLRMWVGDPSRFQPRDDDAMQIAFNVRYLLDELKALGGDGGSSLQRTSNAAVLKPDGGLKLHLSGDAVQIRS